VVATRTLPAELTGKDVVFGIRPEHIRVASEAGLPAEVLLIEPTGSETHLTLRLGGQEIVAVMNDRVNAVAGQTIKLSLASDRAHIFDGVSGQRIDI